MKYFGTPKPRLFAHRGASGTNPENTLESFRAGVDAGADLLELDVHATRDGVVVVMHDPDVSRTTDGQGLVRDLDFAALREFDASAKSSSRTGRRVSVPALAEVLEAFPDTPLNIEIKQDEPAIESLVLADLDAARARDRVMLAAEHQSIMDRIRTAAPDMISSSSAEEVLAFHTGLTVPVAERQPPPGDALQVPHHFEGIEVVTRGFVEEAHRCGVEVHVWTINEEAEMLELLELGVDGIMSDFPEVARKVIDDFCARADLPG